MKYTMLKLILFTACSAELHRSSNFQGRDLTGKMNKDSKDEKYNQIIANLRLAMKNLAEEIKPKVYEYGFLKR